MFVGAKVVAVASDNKNIINMSYMFEGVISTNLDLQYLNTSNVTNMVGMFLSSKVIELDLSTFDTSNAKNMINMFRSTELNVLDLSNFDMSTVTDTTWMFSDTRAKIGYAKTQADVDKLNKSSGKPAGLIFTLK